MSDFFKSAMGYFNSPAEAGQGNTSNGGGLGNGSSSIGGGGPENEFVGQLVEVNSMNLRIKRLIAMGRNTFFVHQSHSH